MIGCELLDHGVVARQNGKKLPCEHLMAENAELRELVRKLVWGYDHDLPIPDAMVWWNEVRAQLRKLGIEVD